MSAYPGPFARAKIVGDEGGWFGRFRCWLGIHNWMLYMGDNTVCQRCLCHYEPTHHRGG